jgi:hypothetical protein
MMKSRTAGILSGSHSDRNGLGEVAGNRMTLATID